MIPLERQRALAATGDVAYVQAELGQEDPSMTLGVLRERAALQEPPAANGHPRRRGRARAVAGAAAAEADSAA